MNELHGARALADRSGDALDRAAAHVADGEHAGMAGLQAQRRAVERPFGRAEVVGGEVGAGLDEAGTVEGQAIPNQSAFGLAPQNRKTC
jgi:hypothetical protein